MFKWLFGDNNKNYQKLKQSDDEARGLMRDNDYGKKQKEFYDKDDFHERRLELKKITSSIITKKKISEGDTFYYGELDTYGKKYGQGCEFNKSNNLKFREGYYENDKFVKGKIWIFKEDHIIEIDESGAGKHFKDETLFSKLEELSFKE